MFWSHALSTQLMLLHLWSVHEIGQPHAFAVVIVLSGVMSVWLFLVFCCLC